MRSPCPITEEVLGVIRERVGIAIPILVSGDRLSQIDFEAASKIANITEKQIRDAFTVGRSVEIERPVRRIAIAPPKWTATKDAESLEDEANFLHSHLIAEMVRHGITVISKQQIDFLQKSIAEVGVYSVRAARNLNLVWDFRTALCRLRR